MIPISKPFLTAEEAQQAYDTILSGWITQGPKVTEFEKNIAEYVGTKYAIAVSNCTTALHLAMLVSEISAGDEVICPSLSYIATANAIKYVNAIPVFAEINPLTYNLDIDDVERKITKKTKAILLVHQIGMPADIDEFSSLAKKYNLKIIEDAACAVGSSYKGKKIGNHSDLVCFSLHPRKVITTGDGGFITTNREDYYERLKLLRQHGMSVNDRERHVSKKVIFENHLEIGYNYRLTDIQASVGIKQLEKLDWIVSERRKIAHKYHEAFKNISYLKIPQEENGYYSNYQSYSIYLEKNCPISRNELMQQMLNFGIATRRGIMTIHREIAYKKEFQNISLPITENVSDNSILLPLFVPMSESDFDYIVSKFLEIILK